MSVLAIIPARQGSKGLPYKNTKIIAGLPLIGWTIQQALKSKIDKVIVSTDGGNIVTVAKACGSEVLMRPPELAQDDSPISETVIHALEIYKGYETVVLLEPTSPLRKPTDIDNALDSFEDADTLVSVGEIHTEHPLIVKRMTKRSGYVAPYFKASRKVYQRQQLDKAYFPYGVIYVARADYYLKHKTFYSTKTLPYFIDRWQNYEIDDKMDFMIVEGLMKWAIRGGLMNGNTTT